jgi:hypothetical protein
MPVSKHVFWYTSDNRGQLDPCLEVSNGAHLPREQVLKHLLPTGSRFVAIAVVRGQERAEAGFFENRDIRVITLAHHHQMMTVGRQTRAQGRVSKNI